ITESNWNEMVDSFDDMNSESLLHRIYAYGFEIPSPSSSEPFFCVEGYDLTAQAPPGTGKMATFALSILQQIELDLKAPQALVKVATEELAQQIQKMFMALGSHGASCRACVGDTNVHAEVQKLHCGYPRLILATGAMAVDQMTQRELAE
uniref:ATP-dependent RNA helicase n=1 Tax=Otolemur garnettii TaxID=30611 RepID=H0XTA4_OTOGA